MDTPAASAPPSISLPANESAPGRIRNTQWRSVPICSTELGAPACGIGNGSGRGRGGAGSDLTVIRVAEILEPGRAIFGITISHCTVDPDSVLLWLARGVRFGAGSGMGSSLSATEGTVSFADSSATNKGDH